MRGAGVQSRTTPGGSLPADGCQLERLQADSQKLQRAFEEFSRLSSEILSSYSSLEEDVENLTDRLEVVSRERLDMLREKQALAARLEGLLSIMPSAVVVVDRQGRIESFNLRAGEIFPDIAAGVSWAALVKRHFDAQQSSAIEAKTNDGRSFHVATCPLEAGRGQLVLLTDVTDMRRLQLQVERNRRLASVGKAIASLSHQLKTPLSVAMIYSAHLCSEDLDAGQKQQMAAKLKDRLLEIDRYINDLLLFARGGRDNATLVEVKTWLEGLSGKWDELARCKGVELAMSLDVPEGTRLLCNETTMGEALTNLVVNGMEACEGQREARVEVSVKAGEHLEFQIEDNGCGLPRELENDIFDPFVSTKPKGTGLGLAVSSAVVRSLGGQITAKNTGRGARFDVRLPLARELHDKVTESGTTPSDKGKLAAEGTDRL
jgi:two-component system sensor histidine kinase FlrB